MFLGYSARPRGRPLPAYPGTARLGRLGWGLWWWPLVKEAGRVGGPQAQT